MSGSHGTFFIAVVFVPERAHGTKDVPWLHLSASLLGIRWTCLPTSRSTITFHAVLEFIEREIVPLSAVLSGFRQSPLVCRCRGEGSGGL